MKKNRNIRYIAAGVITIFALLTLFMSSSVLFDWFGIRAKEGNYILFIVWANFLAGILYLIAAYGFLKAKRWTFWVLSLALLLLIISFIELIVYIRNGNIYETKTVGAMIFRTAITFIFTVTAYIKVWRVHTS